VRIPFSAPFGRLIISVAGIAVSVTTPDDRFLDRLRERYRAFEDCAPVFFDINVQTFPLVPAPHPSTAECRPVVRFNAMGDSFIVRHELSPLTAVCSMAHRRASVSTWEDPRSFDSFLRTLYSIILPERGGVLVNGYAFSERGAGRVLLGVPADMWLAARFRARRLLAGGLVAVRIERDTPQVFSTPFEEEPQAGRLNIGTRLWDVHSLSDSPAVSHRRMDASGAASELCRHTLRVCDDPDLISGAAAVCRAISRTVPVYEAPITRESDPWQVITEAGG
jgi:hypothetical protein